MNIHIVKMSPSKVSTQVRTLQQKVQRNKKIKSITGIAFDSALLHNNFGNMASMFKLKSNSLPCVITPQKHMTVHKILYPSGIRAWGASVDCSPGYLTNVIKMLGAAVAKKSWMSDVVLIVDAMSLRKGTVSQCLVEWENMCSLIWRFSLWWKNVHTLRLYYTFVMGLCLSHWELPILDNFKFDIDSP